MRLLIPQATASHLITVPSDSKFEHRVCFLFSLCEISLRDQTGLLEVHTFSHWLSTFITFTGWKAITSISVCQTYEQVSSVYVRKCIYCSWCMWGTDLKTRTLCFWLHCVSNCVCVLDWMECIYYIIRKYTWRCKANSVCMFVCVLVDSMQKQGCISQMCLYLLCLCTSTDVAVLKVTVLTRTCHHYTMGQWPWICHWWFLTHCPAYSGIKTVKTSVDLSTTDLCLCICAHQCIPCSQTGSEDQPTSS